MHPYTARSLLRIGQISTALGDQDNARRYLTQALASYTQAPWPEHTHTLRTLT